MPDYTITEQDRDILRAVAAWQLGDGIEFRSINGDWPMPTQKVGGNLARVPTIFALIELPASAFRRIRDLERIGLVETWWRDDLPCIPLLNGRPVDSTYTLPNGSAFAVRFVDGQAYIVQASKRRPRLAVGSPDVLASWKWSDGTATVSVAARGFEQLQVTPATSTKNQRPAIERGTRPHDILVAMYRLGAVSRDTRKPLREIVREAFDSADYNSYKYAAQKAKDAGCVEASDGSIGGYWLTAAGVQAAKAK